MSAFMQTESEVEVTSLLDDLELRKKQQFVSFFPQQFLDDHWLIISKGCNCIMFCGLKRLQLPLYYGLQFGSPPYLSCQSIILIFVS